MNEYSFTEKTILTVNCPNYSSEDFDAFAVRLQSSGKKSQIAESFNNINDLQLHHLKHFRHAPYVWKPINGTIWGGMLIDESIDYIHLVLASKDVVEFLINLDKVELAINSYNN